MTAELDSTTFCYVLQRIAERFHTFDYEPRKCNETQIKITVNHLRTDYLMHVINLCPSLSRKAVQSQYLHTRSAQDVASKFLSMWKANLHLQTGLLPSYVTSHRDNDETLQSITDKHLLITQRLMKLLDQTTTVSLHLPLIQLSSLAYWLVVYHSSNKNNPQLYDLYLHQFLSDLVVVFILLLSELFPQAISLYLHQMPEADLPGIEKCYIGLKDPTFVNMNAPECKKKIICYIKQRLATFDYETWGIGDTHIDTVITLYLLNETYKCNVASFMDLSTDPETSDLQQLNEEDVEELVIDLSLIWMETLNILSGSQAKNDIEQLINLIRCPRSFYIPVIQQLSLAYWLLLCYNENGSGDSLYLCDLLNDLIVMFILLLSKLFPSQQFFNLHGDLQHYTRSNFFDYITKDKRPSYIQQSVRQRLEAFDLTYSDAQVMTVVTVYLLSNSYKCHVANVCQDLPIKAIDLTCLHKKDAEEIASKFKSIWSNQISHEVELDYVIIQSNSRTYTTRLELYTRSHINATEQLMELLKQQEQQMHLYVPLQQLLSLAYWLVQYYDRTKGQKRYNVHLHHFLSDFVVIFILLLSKLYPQNYFFASCNLCDLPSIVQTTVRITDFAENSVFRELVLLEICKILCIPMNTKGTASDRIQTLAQSIHRHLMNTYTINNIRWNSRDTQFLCKIIADQVRYMTPNKNRNTVAHKNIANILKFSEVQMGDILSQGDQQEIQQLSEAIIQHRLQNPTNLVALSEMTDTQLNHFYHMAFVGIIWYTDNDCPRINNTGWIEVNNFITYSQGLAQRVIHTAAAMGHNSRSFIAKVTKVLGEIIATRSWLNLEHHKKGIISNVDHKSHRNVLIHFIAFRVLLLYLLPKNLSQYGESDIARHLPQYARNNFIFI